MGMKHISTRLNPQQGENNDSFKYSTTCTAAKSRSENRSMRGSRDTISYCYPAPLAELLLYPKFVPVVAITAGHKEEEQGQQEKEGGQGAKGPHRDGE